MTGVQTCALPISWPVGLLACATWALVAAAIRISALASLLAFAAAPIFAFLLSDSPVVYLSLTIAVLVWVRHHANIQRILSGTEPRIGRAEKPKA